MENENLGHALFDCEKPWDFWVDSPFVSLYHQVRNLDLISFCRLAKKYFKLFTVCLWLVWYVRTVIVMDKLNGEARHVASLYFV